ncbi:MAG: uracil-DNA glycosylase [Rubrivivax sp.]
MTAEDLPAVFAGLPQAWRDVLPGWTPQRLDDLAARILRVSGQRPIAPQDPFRALRLTPPEQVRVVVLGQDPYPTAGHADGLAFSCPAGKPPSLRRIFAVLAADRPGFRPPASWSLEPWARQGVLLLNPALTVEVGRIGSHLDCGWQALTSEIVSYLIDRSDPPAFLLWGAKAQASFDQAAHGTRSRPRVWRTRHPSNDFQRAFMAEGSHFLATAECINWWAFAEAGPSGPDTRP